MTVRMVVLIVSGWCLLFSLWARASTCNDIATAIHADITRPVKAKKQFPWTSLSWLKKQLGQAKMHALSADQTEYKWLCDSENNIYITAIADHQGNLVSIKGIYSSDSGSGLFNYLVPGKTIAKQNTSVEDKVILPCKLVIPKISSDITKYGETISKQHLDWMDLAWLQYKLGKGSTTPITQTFYQWKNYNLLERGGGGNQANGKMPVNRMPHETSSSEEAIRTLGQPDNTYTEVLTQYQWPCPGSGGSVLTVITDKNGVLLDISGQDCSASGCTPFSADLGQSEIEKQFNQQGDQK